MTKQANTLKAGDKVCYGPQTITINEVVYDTVVMGFYYTDGNEELYGWFNASDMVETV